MCILVICFTVYDVINFEINFNFKLNFENNLSFLIMPFSCMTKMSGQKSKHLNPIQDGPFRGCSLKLVTHILNDETGHSYTLPK